MASRWQKTLDTASNFTSFLDSAYSLLTRRAHPSHNGTERLTGLHAEVTIITDRYGVPHIYAQNEEDLYFAQGFIHAQERLWQMELNRRLGAGRLSELLGSFTLETDRFLRRLGLRRSAEAEVSQLTEEGRVMLEAYVRGVNAYLDNKAHKLPAELALLGSRPEPWQIADIIQWGKLLAWNLSGNWETEVLRARLVGKLGAEQAVKLEAGYDPQHPLIVPPGVAYQGVNLGLLEEYERVKNLSGFGTMGGSNNWVVDGTLTETGAPMLCNDPHLRQSMPSIWFECHLVGGEIDVIGASFAGSPGIIIGHNQQIAWGITNAVSDVQDLYIEKFHPDHPTQYEFQGQWEDAQIVREEIKVRGQLTPEIEEVRITRHGPIITNFPTTEQDTTEAAPLALRWVGLEQTHIIAAIPKLNKARNWDEFLAALRNWDAPPQNFVYADRDGNIGYIMAGAIPIRAQTQALLPSPGWSGEYEWTGFIPFEELPQTYNPEQHYIVTANNRVVDDSYPYYITHEWANGYRAQRIRDLLTSKSPLSLADMAEIQNDQYALPATEIVPYMLKIEPDTPLKRAALDILQTWDYVLSPTSIGATLYTTFLRMLERIVLSAWFGDDETLLHHYLGRGANPLVSELNGYANRSKPLLIRLLHEHDDSWFTQSVMINGPRSWDSAVARAFDAAIDELSEKLGHNILRWQYGALHKLTYTHPLGAIKPLSGLLNRGPFAIGGDSDTVNVSNSSLDNPENVIAVASYRQIIDLGNLANSQSIHIPGQSGHPTSKHYDDFIALWHEGHYHPQYFERAEVEAAAEETFQLHPAATTLQNT